MVKMLKRDDPGDATRRAGKSKYLVFLVVQVVCHPIIRGRHGGRILKRWLKMSFTVENVVDKSTYRY